jgi:hypothetical protein
MENMDAELVGSLVNGGKAWLVVTVANLMPALWALTLIFHFSRPYVMRVLRTLSLRFGADVWWLSYVLIRDAVMLIAFAVATISLLPGLFLNVTFPVLAPLSALLFFVALTVKLFTDSDDDPRAFVALSLLLVVAATLYFVPLFFGVQAMDQEFLGEIPMFLVSSTNPAWAWPILVVTLLGYGATGTYIFWRFTRTLRQPAAPQSVEASLPRTV